MLSSTGSKSDTHPGSGIKKLINLPGSIIDFEEQFIPYLWKTYKLLGVAVSKGKEHEWNQILPIPSNAPTDDKTLHKKRLEIQEENVIRYNYDKIALVGDIIQHLDSSSLNMLQLEPEFLQFQMDADPVNLWKLIKEKHQTSGAELRAQKIQERRVLRQPIQNEERRNKRENKYFKEGCLIHKILVFWHLKGKRLIMCKTLQFCRTSIKIMNNK